MSIFEFQISNFKCPISHSLGSIRARENIYSPRYSNFKFHISNFIFQISNFNISGVYIQHNSSLYHQLPRSPSHAKKSQPGQEVSEIQEVPARPRSSSQAKKFQSGQEVSARPRSFRKLRSPSQAKKSQPGKGVPAMPKSPSLAKKPSPFSTSRKFTAVVSSLKVKRRKKRI